MKATRALLLTAFGVWSLGFGAGSISGQSPNGSTAVGQRKTLAKPQTPNAVQPNAVLRVYVITVGEGSYVWEKYGHNALWFSDSAGIDESYSWGTFDFKAPGFVWRFVTGETQYWVEKWPPADVLFDFFAVKEDRTVDVQRLNLTPEQAQRMLFAARTNALPANKYYRYDYFQDNCSTRIRDAIDVALGGALKAQTSSMTDRSYRSESVRLTDDLFFAQLGITMALGRPADAPISL